MIKQRHVGELDELLDISPITFRQRKYASFDCRFFDCRFSIVGMWIAARNVNCFYVENLKVFTVAKNSCLRTPRFRMS